MYFILSVQLLLCIFIYSIFFSFIFSIITNIQDTVSITPLENAKTFVNGLLISESTVLHHVSISK